MFPITDLKGRVIAFGGRALDADAPAKYLNSPETPLFHKGARAVQRRTTPAAAAHDKGQIIVVEGYMDVIALSEAGFPQTVAPLGTALTEDQIKLLWRMAPEPVLCFDGDAAGRARRLPRGGDGAAAPASPASACSSPSCPMASTPTTSSASRAPAPSRRSWHSTRAAVRRADRARGASASQPAVTPEQRRLRRSPPQRTRRPDRRRRRAPPIRAGAARDAVGQEPQAGRELDRAPVAAQASPHAGKRRDNTQLDWRVRRAGQASGRGSAACPAGSQSGNALRAQQRTVGAVATAAAARGPADPHAAQPSLAAGERAARRLPS